jgi:hypothetical protein
MNFHLDFNKYFEEEKRYNKELCRRRKSKKARRRLVKSILKKTTTNGVFARSVRWHYFKKHVADPIKQVIDYEGLARKMFTVREMDKKDLTS